MRAGHEIAYSDNHRVCRLRPWFLTISFARLDLSLGISFHQDLMVGEKMQFETLIILTQKHEVKALSLERASKF